MCPSCGEPLNVSRYRERDDGSHCKSCPNCSRNHGRHAYLSMEEFGERTMADGQMIDQSWCDQCRGGRVGNPAVFC